MDSATLVAALTFAVGFSMGVLSSIAAFRSTVAVLKTDVSTVKDDVAAIKRKLNLF